MAFKEFRSELCRGAIATVEENDSMSMRAGWELDMESWVGSHDCRGAGYCELARSLTEVDYCVQGRKNVMFRNLKFISWEASEPVSRSRSRLDSWLAAGMTSRSQTVSNKWPRHFELNALQRIGLVKRYFTDLEDLERRIRVLRRLRT